jgi:hypothetical protein
MYAIWTWMTMNPLYSRLNWLVCVFEEACFHLNPLWKERDRFMFPR